MYLEANGQLIPVTNHPEIILEFLYPLKPNAVGFYKYLLSDTKNHPFTDQTRNNLFYIPSRNPDTFYYIQTKDDQRRMLKKIQPTLKSCSAAFILRPTEDEVQHYLIDGSPEKYLRFLKYYMHTFIEQFNENYDDVEIVFAVLHTDQSDQPQDWHIHYLLHIYE